MHQIPFLCRWHKSLAHPLLGTYSALSPYDDHVTVQTVVSQLHKTFTSSVFMVVEVICECVHKLHWSFNKKKHVTFLPRMSSREIFCLQRWGCLVGCYDEKHSSEICFHGEVVADWWGFGFAPHPVHQIRQQ